MDEQEIANEFERQLEQEEDIFEILRLWEMKFLQNASFDSTKHISRLAELFERECVKYMLKDPDPFDERHPIKADPGSDWGKNLKILFKKEQFMNRLVNDYLRDNFFTRQNIDKSSFQLNVAACRLILIIMPGLEISAVFQVSNDYLINRLYDWVENAEEPLKSYATGLLGAAMDIQEIAIAYREQNVRLLPILLQRLKQTQVEVEENVLGETWSNESMASSLHSTQDIDDNNDSPYRVIIALYPTTLATRQMLILQYLTAMGEYQEFLPFIFEHNAIEIIFGFLDKRSPRHASIAFEALKYLASLLCHKKCCLEFLNQNGIQKILKLPKSSIISTGAAIALYYIAYCEEAMERICSMNPRVISELVAFVLRLLQCTHDSGRCHATMFLGFCFQFKIMLDEFDKQDGLRQLYNVISILPILANSNEDDYNLTTDEENAQRQVIRHVCVAAKRYFESHLFYKYSHITRSSSSLIVPSRAPKSSQEIINDQIMNLQNTLPMKTNFQPVNLFLQLGGIKLFVLVIAHSYEWNYSGRAETVRSALDVLNICCVLPKVHGVLCERIDFPDGPPTAALNIMLGASEGEIVADSEVQKSALSLLVNVVCAPIFRISGSLARFGSAKKKITDKNSEELIQKVWETVRSNNGIIVLLQLITTKTPIMLTDADQIRGMACRALAGLARSETVRQIISKLPLFVNGQLQQLMRDPILQEKRAEHVQFQKYALELIERISGKPINEDTSIANIHKSNVVAQTKIQFNEKQLYMLIYRHLMESGLYTSAESLMREAKLENFKPLQNESVHSPFVNRSPIIQRSRINKKNIETNQIQESVVQNEKKSMATSATPLTPAAIKLVKKIQNNQSPLAQSANSLEKQATSDVFISTSHKNNAENSIVPTNNVTLNTIVTEYLMNQHSLCKNPMSTCPTFNLFQPHKCPDPTSLRNAFSIPMNIASRHFKRQQGFVMPSRRFDRRFIHSNFDAMRTLRAADADICFTVCDFHKTNDNAVLAGTHNGEVRVMHLNDSADDFSVSCSDTYINNVICSRNGEFVLTSSTWHPPLSNLWQIGDRQFFSKLTFEEEEYVEFNNVMQDKVLGTKGERATIYDINTGQIEQTLQPNIFNQYSKNRATFSPSDELILSDGVLWDVKSGLQIHKFDKLNNQLSGVFHPNGNEIISNSEVWDLRTFHLLRTIPALDQCQIIFSPLNALYAFNIHTETTEDERSHESSFKVLDSFDYSSISTIDTRKSIYDLVVNNNGCQIAICENQGGYESVSESVIRIYAVGRKRDPEDEEVEDDIGSEEEEGLDSLESDGDDDNEFDNRRRRRINLNRNLEDVLDIISLSTESLSSDGALTLEESSDDNELGSDNGDFLDNDDGNSSWETDDE